MQKKILRRPRNRVSRVIFVTGASGSGKSTLATGLARKLGYRLLSLDTIRERFKGDTRKAWLEIWKNIYQGKHVVIDAAGASKIFRLVLRASYFRQLRPTVVKLIAQESILKDRQLEQSKLLPVILASGRMVTQQYLLEATEYLPADLEIDTSRSSERKVLDATLRYVHGRTV